MMFIDSRESIFISEYGGDGVHGNDRHNSPERQCDMAVTQGSIVCRGQDVKKPYRLIIESALSSTVDEDKKGVGERQREVQ
jgi:hypothetical protein